MIDQENPKVRDLVTYTVGYTTALVLTAIAFALVRWRILPAPQTLSLVFGLAFIQIVVHFRFFLHITLGRAARADLQLLLFSALIVLIMVGGTLVVMFNLRNRMMM